MNKSICIIDDDEDVREVLCYALESDGFKVQAFEDAQVALVSLKSLSKENYPNLILLDFMMPGMDGVAFINLIRHEYAASIGTIPLVISTARGSLDRETNIPLDVKIISKPMDLDKLLALANSYCR